MFELKLNVDGFLRLIEDIGENQVAIKNLVNHVGGMDLVINKTINEYKDVIPNEDSQDVILILGNLIFHTFGSETYKEDWETYFPRLRALPVGFLVPLLSNWCPKKRSESLDDSILSYLLTRYYESDLTKVIYNELSEIFQLLEIYPKQFEVFKLSEHYKDELLLFNDLTFLVENKYNIQYESKEIKTVLCQVAIGNKLNSIEKLRTFCELVELFAPSNYFNRLYRDAFVMEIYESVYLHGGEWNQIELCVWQEEFIDIDFEQSYQELSGNITMLLEQESNHISEQLKINPNYRHD